MRESKIIERCQWCGGTGINKETKDILGNPIEIPCTYCGADGKFESSRAVDTTDIMEDLDKIKKRLKKIMDKLEVGD